MKPGGVPASQSTSRRVVSRRKFLVVVGTLAVAGATGTAYADSLGTGSSLGVEELHGGADFGVAAGGRVYETDLPILDNLQPLVSVTSKFSAEDLQALQEVMNRISAETPVHPRMWTASSGRSVNIDVRYRAGMMLPKAEKGMDALGSTTVCSSGRKGGTCSLKKIDVDSNLGVREAHGVIHHEFLHALGVGHCSDHSSVMYENIHDDKEMPPGIDAGDIQEVIRLYSPKPQPAPLPRPSGDEYPI